MAKNDFNELMSIGIDIGKDTCHIVAFDPDGQLVIRKQIKRLALVQTFEKLPRCVVGKEACRSAHFVSRTLRKMGFEPRIIPAIYVKPFIKGQKNDYNVAEAIAQAALRLTKRGSRYLRMLFVQAAKVILMRTNRWPDFSFGDWLLKARNG